MNTQMLDMYCTYHLEDIGEYTPSKLVEFKGQCTVFLEDIKSLDRELYRDVMSMPIPKQVGVMKSIYESHNFTKESAVAAFAQLDPDLADYIREEYDMLIEETAAIGGAVQSNPMWWDKFKKFLFKVLNYFKSAKFSTPEQKGGVIVVATVLALNIGPILSFLSSAVLGILSALFNPWAYVLVVGLLVLMVAKLGANRISGMDVLVAKIKKLDIATFQFSSKSRATNILLTTQMHSCLSSNITDTTQEVVRNHIVYDLFLKDRGDKVITPAGIAADKVLECSLSYMTNTIAEMYTALNNCMIATKSPIPKSPAAFTSLNSNLSTLNMSPECESIRTALDEYVAVFEEILSNAFNKDPASAAFWRSTLQKQISTVMGGTHASPIKSASRGTPKRLTNSVIRFDRNAKLPSRIPGVS